MPTTTLELVPTTTLELVLTIALELMPTTTLELVPSVVAVAASHVPVAVAVLWKQLRPRYHLPRRGGRLRESREWSIDNRLCLAAVGSRMSCDIGVCTRVPWLGAVDSGAVAVRAVSRARVCELTCVACHESRPRPACHPAWRHTCETPRLCVEVGTCWRCFVYGSMNIPVRQLCSHMRRARFPLVDRP